MTATRMAARYAELMLTMLDRAVAELDGAEALATHGAWDHESAPACAVSGGGCLDRARLLAWRALLTSLADTAAGRRVERERQFGGRKDRVSTVEALEAIFARSGSAAAAAEALLAIDVGPVFTAHPTEMRRRTILDREAAITALLATTNHRLSKRVTDEVMGELFRHIATLWRTRLHRPDRIGVLDELQNTLGFVRRAILPALVDLYAEWEAALGLGPDMPTPLKLGSWVGGDRDGHPGVSATSLRAAFTEQAKLAIEFYCGELDVLTAELTVSDRYGRASQALRALAEQSPETSIHRADEPYRRALILIRRRLEAFLQALIDPAAAGEVAPYASPAAFLADLRTVRESLAIEGDGALTPRRLDRLIVAVRALGFHVLTLDLRQNADVHERAIAELFESAGVNAGYLELDEPRRVALLVAELGHARLLRSPFLAYTPETTRELDILDAAAWAVARFGPGCIRAYVVSKSSAVSDIIEPYVLMKQAGLVRGGVAPYAAAPVTPLFETIEDLEAGPRLIAEWLELPVANRLLGERHAQEVMLGYSDSGKDGGPVASRWAIHTAATAIQAVCAAHDVNLKLFHGRGGSLGRGGGAAFGAQPAMIAGGRVRLTEQGEMIARRFGAQEHARASLDELTAIALQAREHPAAPEPEDVHRALAALARGAKAAWRALVYDDADFQRFFELATPIAEIRDLNIGSRPSARTLSQRIEDLRAIPWVFSWSQARFLLPGWYGFAAGARAAKFGPAELRDLAERSPLFANLARSVEGALAQSDMSIARTYAGLAAQAPGAARIMAAIEAEHDAAAALVEAVRAGDPGPQPPPDYAMRLLADLHALQVELMRRRRGGDQSEETRLSIQLTIGGIAAALKETG